MSYSASLKTKKKMTTEANAKEELKEVKRYSIYEQHEETETSKVSRKIPPCVAHDFFEEQFDNK